MVIPPGKWDTAVGGHLSPGENYEEAARREMQEELGIPADLKLDFLFNHRIRNEIESENTAVFAALCVGPFHPDSGEIEEVRFWTRAELLNELEGSIFTPVLVEEIKFLLGKKTGVILYYGGACYRNSSS
jgi:isopentenyldiphosphate isomerase